MMKRLFDFLLMVLVLTILHFTYSCAAVNADRQRHTQEGEALNTLAEKYMVEYRKADFNTQVQWKYRIDPQLKKAKWALFSWDVAIAVKELDIAKEKERSFLIAKDRAMFSLKEVIK